MSTVRTTLDRPAGHAGDLERADRTVVALDTPLMRAVERHPAGRALVDGPRTAPRSAPPRPTPRPASRPAYRLTRRGRLAVFAAALLAVGGLTVGLGTQVIATSDAGDPVPSRAVVVQPGETVWDLAADANPSGDIRETVHDIAELNSLESAGEVAAGSTIYIPLY
ncbi:LysM peptidoglycan-binding domain-containing protein [Mumia sp. Pv 4-285]|uniref:LysM peptidoglycan-binding domain-containing protein n=1 Tax=Mumia qirimensis TaxID=3234852 RepID=UPI00351D4A37